MASCVTLHNCKYISTQSHEQRRETEERIRKIMSAKTSLLSREAISTLYKHADEYIHEDRGYNYYWCPECGWNSKEDRNIANPYPGHRAGCRLEKALEEVGRWVEANPDASLAGIESNEEKCPHLQRAELAEAKLAEIQTLLGKNT